MYKANQNYLYIGIKEFVSSTRLNRRRLNARLVYIAKIHVSPDSVFLIITVQTTEDFTEKLQLTTYILTKRFFFLNPNYLDEKVI